MKKPESVNILSREYKVTYLDSIEKVNTEGRDQAFGMANFHEHTIRLFEGKMVKQEVMSTLMHEIIEIISKDLELCLCAPENHKDLNTLATVLVDTFIRNGWINMTEWKSNRKDKK